MSDESLAEYTDRVIPSWWEHGPCVFPSWKDPEPPLDPVLLDRVAYYFRRGLELLDAVPRNDPFWERINNKATVYKAQLWFGQVLKANPGDIEARWILAAFALAHCSEDVIALLAPLVTEYPSSLSWLVDVAVWIWEVSGADYAGALRDELSMLRNDPAVCSLIEAPAGNDELGRAVQVARSVLGGNSIFVAAEGLTGK